MLSDRHQLAQIRQDIDWKKAFFERNRYREQRSLTLNQLVEKVRAALSKHVMNIEFYQPVDEIIHSYTDPFGSPCLQENPQYDAVEDGMRVKLVEALREEFGGADNVLRGDLIEFLNSFISQEHTMSQDFHTGLKTVIDEIQNHKYILYREPTFKEGAKSLLTRVANVIFCR